LRLFAAQGRKRTAPPTLLRVVSIDGLPGCVGLDPGGALRTTAIDIQDGTITVIYIVRNPDKLKHLAAEMN
jgi:hypothetical protein